jgi:hypothetical protein
MLASKPEIRGWSVLLCGFIAFLYLPTRLVEEATPEWRPIQWSLGIQTVVLTLYAIYLAGGKSCLGRPHFPWLSFWWQFHGPRSLSIQSSKDLSRINAAMVVNVMGILNVPAIQHGNVIEVSTGMSASMTPAAASDPCNPA